MPNLDPSMNQQNEEESPKPSKFENHLLSIRDERQRMIYPNCHPTYNERHEKIIEMIDWALEKYRGKIKENHNEQIIIDNIIKKLAQKRDIALHKKKQAQLKDEVWKYSEEDTTDYVIFRIREMTSRLV